MSDDVVTLAASVARLEEKLAAERAEDKKERAADKDAFIDELRGIKDTLKQLNKAEEDKAKAKKEREDAEARMWQGFKDGLYATFLSQFTWTHKGGGFCNDTRMKAE